MEAMMSLNIKSEHAHELARQLAKETGLSMTAAIEKALEDQLMRIHHHQEREYRFKKIKEIVSKLPPPPPGVTSDHSDLYDEYGLPA
jgi:antitoxin VapB